MKKLSIALLCLALLTGCVRLPSIPSLLPTAEPADPTAKVTTPPPVSTPEESLLTAGTPVPAEATPAPTQAPTASLAPTPRPTPAPTPTPTAIPTPTPLVTRSFAGDCLRFEVPADWTQADLQGGTCFYPTMKDTQHTFLLYQEQPNTMGLTETQFDLALMFSSQETIMALVEGELAKSGLTGFQLSDLAVNKTKLNGLTCYRVTAKVTAQGEGFDFVGHVFLQGDTLALLVWVGDETPYARELARLYDSLTTVAP